MNALKELIRSGQALVFPPAAPDGPDDVRRGQEHRFSGHTPLWAYSNPQLATPFADPGRPPIFEVLDPGLDAMEAMRRTNLLVFAGATPSPALARALARADACTLIFEPDPNRLAALAEDLGHEVLSRADCYLFGGDALAARPLLLRALGALQARAGFPVFLVQQGLEVSHPGYLEALIQSLEVLFFRLRIYTVEGQWLSQSRPVRDIAQGLFFDQLKHLYENLPDLAAWPGIDVVENAFPGATAILVAAGPDLADRLDWIRDNAGRALVIAISRTSAELVAAGIHPHFAIINDTSVYAEAPLAHLPDMGRTVLVAHSLSPLGQDAFRRKVFFGTALPELLGQRPMLRLHGSVISSAFALARWLGCARAVLVGAQMASHDPWTFAYSKGSSAGQVARRIDKQPTLPHRHPQLLPVTAASGRTMYTTLNFMDATHWLLDEIGDSGMEVVNTSEDSILHGPGVTVDQDYAVPPASTPRRPWTAWTSPSGPRTGPRWSAGCAASRTAGARPWAPWTTSWPSWPRPAAWPRRRG